MKKQLLLFVCLLLTSFSSRAENLDVDGVRYSLDASNHTATVIYKDNYT